MNNITICYMTNRMEPMFWWFISSLRIQCNELSIRPQIVIVDFWAQEIPHYQWGASDVAGRRKSIASMCAGFNFKHVPPKPTPWQGPYRLTKNDYFAAANARNTAICHAVGDYIIFCDDLSVLLPGWLKTALEHVKHRRIVCGAFRKVKNLKVENGVVQSFDDHQAGHDSRWNEGNSGRAVPCPSNWLFGCSFGSPTQFLLDVNGLCEDADSTGIGAEDCALGVVLGNNGHALWYDRRMMTYESEEHHHNDKIVMRRDDKKPGGTIQIKPGESHPNEKGWAFYRAYKIATRFANYFGEGGIAALRKSILAGGSFSTGVIPEHDFFDKQSLTEL